MTIVMVLLVIGVLLLAAEIFVPGAVLGIIGGLFLVAGVVVAFMTLTDAVAFMVLGVASLAGVTVFVLEFTVLPRTRMLKSLSMTETVTGRSQAVDPAEAKSLIGSGAVAQTMLAPSGYVLAGGKRYEAFCRDGLVEAGVQLQVVDVDNFRLIVTRIPS